MHWQYTPYTLPLIIAAALSAALALSAWRRRPASGATPVALLMLAVAEWQLGYALELASADLPSQLLWGKVQYLGMVMVPVMWLAFVLQYTGREKWLTRRNLALLAIEPLLTLLLAWTNEVHGLIYSSFELSINGSFSRLHETFGIWAWVDVAYSYVLIMLSTLLLIQAFIRSPRLYRGQIGVLLIGAFAPWAAEALSISGLRPFPHLNLTPLAFMLTGLAMIWGRFCFQLLDIAPVARDAVIESMGDGVIVLDTQNRIVDLNPAAERIIGSPAEGAIGQPAIHVLSAWPNLVRFYGDVTEAQEEIVLGEGEAQRTYDLRVLPLYDRRGRLIGRLLILRDFTDRKRAEEALRRRAEEMAALVEMNRAITEDIDLKETLDRILSNAQKIIPVSDCSVTLVDESSEDLVVEASTDGEIGLRISPAAPSAVGWVVKTKQILAEEDVSSNPIFSQQLVQRYGFKSGLAVPIIYRDKAIGTLSFGNRHVRRAFSDSEKMMAQAFAYQAAIAIQNARLFEAEREQRELAEALEEAAATVSNTLDLDEVLDRILEQAERVVAGEAFSIILIEDDVARLVRWRGYELPGEETLSSRFDIPMARYSTLMKMARMGKPVIVPDTSLDPDWVPAVRDQAGWRRSYVGVPIRLGDKTAGFLSASGTRPGQFGPEDVRRMEALASHAAAAIGNARLYEELQRKVEELELLLDVATAVSSTLDLDYILRTLAEKMTTSVGATFCRIALLDEMNQTLTIRATFAAHDLGWDPGLGRQYALADAPWHRQVIERRDIVILRQDDPPKAVSETECRIALSEGIQSALLIPLVIGERTLGVVSLGEMRSWERLPLTADRVRLCQAMANQAAIAIENARLLDAINKHRTDLQRLSVQLLSAQEEERRRLSLELHDELGQALTAISFDLAAIEKELPPELAPKIREILAETSSLVNEVDDQVRELALDLRPYMLDDLGLVPALRWYVNRYAKRLNIEVEMEAIDFEERVTPQVETALYRVVQEALTNVSRHAQANRVSIRLERKESAVIAFIEDDGQGFDVGKIAGPYPPERGAGLLGIRERVASLGGTFSIQSHPGEGTRLTIEIPM